VHVQLDAARAQKFHQRSFFSKDCSIYFSAPIARRAAAVLRPEVSALEQLLQLRGTHPSGAGLIARPVQSPAIEPLGGHVKAAIVISKKLHSIGRSNDIPHTDPSLY
jgi:hypothetical protein